MTPDRDRCMWVVAEHAEGRLQPVTHEVLAFAHRVGSVVGCRVLVVVIGDPVRALAEEIVRETGCDVMGLESPGACTYNAETYRGLLTRLYESRPPEYIFVAHTSTGLDVAPSLAVDLGASCITGVSDFKYEEGPVFTRQLCNGKILEDVRPLTGRPAVVTILPGAEDARSRETTTPGSVELYAMEISPARARTVSYTEPPPSSVDLRDAEVIVAAGRGIGAPEHLEMLRELAARFKRSTVAASRPLCDLGWLPLEYQVGMTGQTVSPRLYIACGISGAVQHTMGMKKAGLIVAINSDKNALFFQVAHYCVIADLRTFIPALIEKIREYLKTSGR